MLKPERFIRSMEKTALILQDRLADVTQEQAVAARDGEDGWNVVEIVCHLRDFEEIFFSRARQMMEKDNPELKGYDHEALAIDRNYAEQKLTGALGHLMETRKKFLIWLQSREPDDWKRTAIHPEQGKITLLEQAMQVPCHDVDHIEQIMRILLTAY